MTKTEFENNLGLKVQPIGSTTEVRETASTPGETRGISGKGRIHSRRVFVVEGADLHRGAPRGYASPPAAESLGGVCVTPARAGNIEGGTNNEVVSPAKCHCMQDTTISKRKDTHPVSNIAVALPKETT
jgi:hypothetical protein